MSKVLPSRWICKGTLTPAWPSDQTRRNRSAKLETGVPATLSTMSPALRSAFAAGPRLAMPKMATLLPTSVA